MAKKGEFLLELRAEALGLSMENLAAEADAAFKKSIEDVATGAWATINAMAQHRLSSTTDDYRRGLNFQKIGEDSYLITLDGEWPNALEKGYGPYSIRERMLKSQKIVQVGPRTGLPWVQKAQDGHKFAHVPYDFKPFSKAPQGADMAAAIKQLTAQNAQGAAQKITKIFRDASGNAVDSGSGKDTRSVARVTDVSALDTDKFASAMGKLAGLTKFQKVTRSKSGKETVQSIYMTWRTVSEAGKDWTHPGFKGVHIFDDVEKWVGEQLDLILKNYLR